MLLERIRDYRRVHGTRYTLRRGAEKAAQRVLGTYDRLFAAQRPGEGELARQRREQPYAGLLSVIVPVYNTEPALLRALLDSLAAQTYSDWEAVLYDGASTRPGTREVLEAAAAAEPRFRVIRGEVNEGISGNTNAAAALARGEYLVLCDHDDWLSPEALWRMAEAIADGRPDWLYSDEDRMTEDGSRRMDPHWKPDYCPVTLLCANYICHLTAVKKSLLEQAGGLRPGFDGSQDHDLFLRLAELSEKVAHVPRTLYSWREVRASMSHRNLQKCLESGCRAVEEHEARLGRRVVAIPVDREIRLWYDVPREATVDALIFGSSEAACREGAAELDFRTQAPRLRAVPVVPGGDGLYAALNRAAEASRADYLLLLDADARGMNRHLLRELLMYAQREDTAAVTAQLCDSRRRITHGGYAVGLEGLARCVNEGLFATAGGWHDVMNRVHNVSAVSPCCTLVRRAAWIPFDPAYRGGLGAVDWCLRQKARGLWCVYTPHARAELGPRPLLLSGPGRDPRDAERFRAEYGDELPDPCYGGRFSRERADFSPPRGAYSKPRLRRKA